MTKLTHVAIGWDSVANTSSYKVPAYFFRTAIPAIKTPVLA